MLTIDTSAASAVGPLAQACRPCHELADIFRLYGPAYRQAHRLPVHHHRVMRAIEVCRTAALRGHVDECDSCGHPRIAYNSCRDRHCPKCQSSAQRRWVEARRRELLPIEYFHVVFTLPDQLTNLARYNRGLIYNLLFRATAETLLEFGERHWGGELGVTAVLHTWGQTLVEHPHLHCIVTGGALSKDGQRWRSCKPGYLFPVRALSAVFRGKYCALLERAYRGGHLAGGESLPELSSEQRFTALLRRLREQAWVVYAKRPFASPTQVISYIGRYTHRVAISNSRITDISEGRVSFRYKDYRDGERQKVMTLEAAEFIRRFLQHVLPPEFVRIRHYGLLANGRKHEKLQRCRELLESGESRRLERASQETDSVDGVDAEVERCEQCGVGRMMRREELPPNCGPPRCFQQSKEREASIPHS